MNQLALNTIALYELGTGAEKEIPALKGLVAKWAESLSAESARALAEYIDARNAAAKDLADMLDANPPSRKGKRPKPAKPGQITASNRPHRAP